MVDIIYYIIYNNSIFQRAVFKGDSMIKRYIAYHMDAFFSLTPEQWKKVCEEGVSDDGCYTIPEDAKYLKTKPRFIRKQQRDLWSTDNAQPLVMPECMTSHCFKSELEKLANNQS